MKNEEKIKLKCPYCKSVIANIEILCVNKKYKCTKCSGIYFVILVPREVFYLKS